MKGANSTDAIANLNSAFAKINIASGEELNNIVDIIEQNGRKGKVKKKIAISRKQFFKKRQFATS